MSSVVLSSRQEENIDETGSESLSQYVSCKYAYFAWWSASV